MASITLPSLATIATVTTAASAAASAGLGISSALASGPKASPTLAMPNPNDPALLNQQKTMLALAQGRGGRASTNLSGAASGNGSDYSTTLAGSG